jgi:hypothetical protein
MKYILVILLQRGGNTKRDVEYSLSLEKKEEKNVGR